MEHAYNTCPSSGGQVGRALPSGTVTRRSQLPFYFDPVPDRCRPDLAGHKLTPIDGLVLGRCLRQRRAAGHAPGSACTKELIGEALGRHPRTIQRSFARLKAAGHIAHVEDPTDSTGYRIEFPNLAPIRVHRETGVSLGGRQPCLSGGDSRVSPPQPYTAHARETETADMERQTDDGPSSSGGARDEGTGRAGRPDPRLEAAAARWAAVAGAGPVVARCEVAGKARAYGLENVRLAVDYIANRRSSGKTVHNPGAYLATVLGRWERDGITPEAAAAQVEAQEPRPVAGRVEPPLSTVEFHLKRLENSGYTMIEKTDGTMAVKRIGDRQELWNKGLAESAGVLMARADELHELLSARDSAPPSREARRFSDTEPRQCLIIT